MKVQVLSAEVLDHMGAEKPGTRRLHDVKGVRGARVGIAEKKPVKRGADRGRGRRRDP